MDETGLSKEMQEQRASKQKSTSPAKNENGPPNSIKFALSAMSGALKEHSPTTFADEVTEVKKMQLNTEQIIKDRLRKSSK